MQTPIRLHMVLPFRALPTQDGTDRNCALIATGDCLLSVLHQVVTGNSLWCTINSEFGFGRMLDMEKGC